MVEGLMAQAGFENPPRAFQPGIILYRSGVRSAVTEATITDTLNRCAGQGIHSVLLGQLNDMGAGDENHLSENWQARLAHLGKTADRTGMTLGLFIAPGWSGIGGPWIPPEESQQRLVYGKTRISGPQTLALKLAVPEDGAVSMAPYAYATNEIPDDYRDIAVLAMKVPTSHVAAPASMVPSATGFVLEFDQPVSARSLFMLPDLAGKSFPQEGDLLASMDGTEYVHVSSFRFPPASSLTVGFAPTLAKYFKVDIRTAQSWNGVVRKADRLAFHEVRLMARPSINHLEWKNGATIRGDYFPETLPGSGTPPGEVVDLTAQLSPAGVLSWEVPPGDWVVLRIGHRFNRKFLHPVGKRNRGYACDPLSPKGIRTHFDSYVLPYAARIRAGSGSSLNRLHIDSWESGSVNWTPAMADEFRKRRGYDLRPYLPVLTGEVIGSSEISERFLADFRRTIADLIADNYYGKTAELSHQAGMVLSAQAGKALGRISDPLMNFGRVDIPHTEFWFDSSPAEWAKHTKIAASAKRAYGTGEVGAESFSSWHYFREYPFALKPYVDAQFAAGLNHVDLHVGILQPADVGDPGMFPTFGSFFNAHNTYWSRFHVFTDYLTRCQYLLSQGVFVGDILYYSGDEPCLNNSMKALSHSPKGYDCDVINTECLINKLAVENGELVLGDGHYRLLVLPDAPDMRVGVAEKIESLVKQGALVAGPRPQRAVGLEGYPENDRKVQAIAAQLWGEGLVSDVSVAEALKQADIPPDVVFEETGGSRPLFIHNRTPSRDIYFLSNPDNAYREFSGSFRVSGRIPHLWHPGDGRKTPVPAYDDDGGRTRIPLRLAPFGSVFVVFSEKGRDELEAPLGAVRSTPGRDMPEPMDLSSDWSVVFERIPSLGTVHFPKLVSWTKHPDERIKYYSGEAVYERSFELPAAVLPAGGAVVLDLGSLGAMAEVHLNGKPIGILWKPPYRLDVTKAIRPGRNDLNVVVVNTWFNRLFYETVANPGGSHLLDLSRAPAIKTIHDSIENQPLMPSGLFGPVRLVFGVRKIAQ